MRKRALGYVRVSTDEQVAHGWGLAAQRDRITDEAQRRGWDLQDIVADEGVSGKQINRPGIERVLRSLAEGEADILVVAKLDRLSRSLLDFAGVMDTARREGWQFVALDLGVDTSTPAGAMVANVMAAFAQYERELISARVKEGLAAARRRGKQLGRPSGITQAVRVRIRREAAAGRSYRAIARDLTADNVPTPQGGTSWAHTTVRAVCVADE